MVRARQLLPCPEACPSAVYSLMVECWHEQAVRRPSFPEIGHRLKIWYQAQKRSKFRSQTQTLAEFNPVVFLLCQMMQPKTHQLARTVVRVQRLVCQHVRVHQ